MQLVGSDRHTMEADTPVFTLAGDAGAPVAPTKDLSELDLAEKRHVGMIFLDKIGEGQHALTNVETKETVRLEGDGWELVEHDGFYAAVRDRGADGAGGDDHEGPSAEVVLMDEVFQRPAFVSIEGETYVKMKGQFISLDIAKTRFKQSTFNFKDGTTKVDLLVYWFVVPRAHGMRGYWDLHKIYVEMGLDQFHGQACHWVYRSAASWKRISEQVFKVSHLVDSSMSKCGLGDAAWVNMCLPHKSCSTALLIYLASLWSTASQRRGGFKEEKHRNAAHQVLRAMGHAAGLAKEQGVVFTIEFEEHWAPRWPRPALYGVTSVELTCKDMMVDLGPLRRLASDAGGSGSLAARYLAPVKQAIVQGSLATFSSLFNHLHGAKKDKSVASSFLAQLVLQLAYKVDEGLRAVSPENGSWDMQWQPMHEGTTKYELEHLLVRYAVASRMAAEGHQHFVIATDAHDGCGLKLHNTVIGLKSNLLIVTAPQARSASTPLRSVAISMGGGMGIWQADGGGCLEFLFRGGVARFSYQVPNFQPIGAENLAPDMKPPREIAVVGARCSIGPARSNVVSRPRTSTLGRT